MLPNVNEVEEIRITFPFLESSSAALLVDQSASSASWADTAAKFQLSADIGGSNFRSRGFTAHGALEDTDT